MVDGMGTTGTQGVFQRCAEETLRVLRSDSEVVLTVLEVFKYDPLHSWCVNHCLRPSLVSLCSPLPPHLFLSRRTDTKINIRTASEFKIKRAQASSTITDPSISRTPGLGGAPELDMSSGTADEAADRALTAVARKLDRALSTEYTVNDLIAEATDPTNLACMFIGGRQEPFLRHVNVSDVIFLMFTCRLEPTSVRVSGCALRDTPFILLFHPSSCHYLCIFSIP